MHAGSEGGSKKGKRQLQSWAHSDSTRAAKSAAQRRVFHGSDGNTYNTHGPPPRGRERGERLLEWERDVLSNVVRTTELLDEARRRLVISPS